MNLFVPFRDQRYKIKSHLQRFLFSKPQKDFFQKRILRQPCEQITTQCIPYYCMLSKCLFVGNRMPKMEVIGEHCLVRKVSNCLMPLLKLKILYRVFLWKTCFVLAILHRDRFARLKQTNSFTAALPFGLKTKAFLS